jgi:hypothetical protein
VVTYSLLVSSWLVVSHIQLLSVLMIFQSQISFVMEAFFLHYKKPNGTSGNESDEDDDFSLSEQLRVERQLAFAIV